MCVTQRDEEMGNTVWAEHSSRDLECKLAHLIDLVGQKGTGGLSLISRTE